MTMGVFDFKSIGRKLNRLEQKAEFEEKNPKPLDAAPIVWTPEWGYGVPVSGMTEMSPSQLNDFARYLMAKNSKGFDLPDVRGQIEANG